MNETTARQPPSQATDAPAATPTWQPPKRRKRTTIVIVLLATGAVLAVLAAWRLPPFAGGPQVTDNAYVRGRTVVIAPQVGGYIVAVEVKDYERVEAGQVLVRIDDRIYRARVEQAQANVSTQRAALDNNRQARASRDAGVLSQAAALVNARAQLGKARTDMRRIDDLATGGFISAFDRDHTEASLRHAEAQVDQAAAAREVARQELIATDVGRVGLEAQVEAALAQLRLAQIDLDNTVIRAPESGQVGEVGVRLGQFVAQGTSLLALVPPDRWIIANFKESQARTIAPNQTVRFAVDGLGRARLDGRVERLSPAAASEFAVLKPDNATGNFVKVPQRIGVRIAIDPNQPLAEHLRPGMSVEVRIDTRSRE